jgi:hypothetical protein
MVTGGTEIYILYQIGMSDEWTWFSPIGIFLSEKGVLDYVEEKEFPVELPILEPDGENGVVLTEPQDFVIVRSTEGEVPEVELEVPE